MKPKPYEEVYVGMIDVPSFDIEKATQEVKRLYNVPHIYIEKDLAGAWGKAMPLLHIVFIQTRLKEKAPNQYIMTYAHELTHIKYATTNETFTTYKSITTLYESGIDYLQATAWNEAVRIMRGYYNGDEYDCGAQLIEYFGVGI